ncbi:hypothetical protein CICLE_v10007265mg [Citrus x clementina]|uniref:Uncharacterized protein n=1 Tax=Citrus clementina TaxID=85681 RepID=V4WE29_CITCL|nr:hypothetical protein CICLE_v10007265mg [Citrus x clementina]
MSSKFDLPSGSPDRPLYTSGQRGPHLAAALDRSSSFRESIENPVLSSLPNTSRGPAATAEEVSNFLQCLRFNPKAVAADHKSNRLVDFRRHMNVALGLSADDSPTGSSKGKLLPCLLPEEIKRVKGGLRDSTIKARERVKIFNEALSVFNKFFPSVPSKKRSRSEVFPYERSSSLLSSEHAALGPNLGKIGMQSHALPGGFELEQQKSEERIKNAVPSKRTRTSLVDVRGNAIVRPSGTIDRDKEMLRLANSGGAQGEDRTLPIGVDGWEKSKMKKKRSGIKPEASPSFVSSKPTDGYRDQKQGMQQRPVTDGRPRSNNDTHGFRPGVANGAVGVGKSDGISQQTGLGVRSSIPRTELDNSSLLNDRRDRPIGSDKERVNLRAVNKTNVRDEFNSASPTSNTKMTASVRGPRSGSGVAPKLSPVVHRAAAPNDWEVSHCMNKPTASVGPNNRKRTMSARSSSPPVAHWAGQRPQKISRTARRTNIVPIVSNNDETAALDSSSDVAGSEIGGGFGKRLSSNSPQQVKLKGDSLSSAALSESEESGVPSIKSKDKGRKSDEIDEKAGQNVQKVSTLVLPSRKNKPVYGDDLGDGVRRQGRTGRSFASARALLPMTVEKLGNAGTAKQLRSARLGFDKIESKAGRPPTRKLSDRKAYKRQKPTTISAAADFIVGSDDGHEELLAAANAVINSAHTLSSSFWRQMEPLFGFISDGDIAYLKLQERDVGPVTGAGRVEQLVPSPRGYNAVPLYQRLIAALITEEDCGSGDEDLKIDTYGTGFELDEEFDSNGSVHQFNFHSAGITAFNGCRITGKGDIDDEAEGDLLGISNSGITSNFNESLMISGMAFSEFQYDNMRVNEKLLLETGSIGIFPDPMSDKAETDDGVCEDIKKLEDKYHEQVCMKQGLLDRLLKYASEIKELQEREFEQRALDKLVTMAYEKYMTCWGPNTGKSSSNKLAKQAALAFVKRTLDHCHKFEDTGRSCFSEQLFRDMFASGLANPNGGRSVDTSTESEFAKPYSTSSHSLEARVSASMGSQTCPLVSTMGQNEEIFDMLPPINRSSELSTGKEDTWSNRVKKKELLLDEVVGCTIGSSNAPSSIGSSLSSSTKGKRSERDREGKVHSREVLSRNGANKIGRPTLCNTKGERKSKAKPKQKTTQLSVSVNGLLGKMSEQAKPTLPSASKSSEMTTNSNAKDKDEFGLDVLDGSEPIDLDVLGDDQGQDLGSWLNMNIDDDGLQDHDFMGLEIPMDDLSDLNMMV